MAYTWREKLDDESLKDGTLNVADAEALLRTVGDLLSDAERAHDALRRYVAARRAAESSGMTVDDHNPGVCEETADAAFNLLSDILYP